MRNAQIKSSHLPPRALKRVRRRRGGERSCDSTSPLPIRGRAAFKLFVCHELQIRSPFPNTCLACCQIVRNGWLVAALCAAPVKCEGLHFGIIFYDGVFRLHVRLASAVPWGIAAALPPATRQFCWQAGHLLSQSRGGCAKTSTFTALKSRTTSKREGVS